MATKLLLWMAAPRTSSQNRVAHLHQLLKLARRRRSECTGTLQSLQTSRSLMAKDSGRSPGKRTVPDDQSSEHPHGQAALEVLTPEAVSKTATVEVMPGKGPPPEAPVFCCMSGCTNCVWIVYAEELKEYYRDGGKRARRAIESVEDPSLRAFLLLELDQ